MFTLEAWKQLLKQSHHTVHLAAALNRINTTKLTLWFASAAVSNVKHEHGQKILKSATKLNF